MAAAPCAAVACGKPPPASELFPQVLAKLLPPEPGGEFACAGAHRDVGTVGQHLTRALGKACVILGRQEITTAPMADGVRYTANGERHGRQAVRRSLNGDHAEALYVTGQVPNRKHMNVGPPVGLAQGVVVAWPEQAHVIADPEAVGQILKRRPTIASRTAQGILRVISDDHQHHLGILRPNYR